MEDFIMIPTRRNYNQSWLPSVFFDLFDNDSMLSTNVSKPAVNVLENEKSYQVEVAVPGMTKEDFHIRLGEDDQILISMEKKQESDSETQKEVEETSQKPVTKYLRREFSYQKFEQSFILPNDVDKEKISATVKDGVLTVTMPKYTEEEKAKACKTIEIQ